MFEGTEIEIGGRKYTIPPLSLGQLRRGFLKKIQEHDELIQQGKYYDAVAIRAEIIIASLKRNYNDLDEDFILDNLDISNTNPIWYAALGISGLLEGGAADAKADEDPMISGPSTANSPVPISGQ